MTPESQLGKITPFVSLRAHDEHMNTGVIVLLVAVTWSLLSIVVALAVGGIAKARDDGAVPQLDQSITTRRISPPARDKNVRTAV